MIHSQPLETNLTSNSPFWTLLLANQVLNLLHTGLTCIFCFVVSFDFKIVKIAGISLGFYELKFVVLHTLK